MKKVVKKLSAFRPKKIQKTFQKPLDNCTQCVYNIAINTGTASDKPMEGYIMKKMVYVIREMNARGDDFDLYFTFDLYDARYELKDSAWRGYKLNKKKPSFTTYHIFGYEIDTEEIDETYEYNVEDARSIYIAYSNSVCWLEESFEETYEVEDDN